VQCGAVWCSVVQCGTVCCSVVQCGAVWCSVLQCVAVCCSVLQCVADIAGGVQESIDKYNRDLLYENVDSHVHIEIGLFCKRDL